MIEYTNFKMKLMSKTKIRSNRRCILAVRNERTYGSELSFFFFLCCVILESEREFRQVDRDGLESLDLGKRR